MTIAEALRILELTPPISRKQLSHAFQQAQLVWCVGRFEGNLDLIAKAKAMNLQIKAAHAVLTGLPENAPPFQDGALPPGPMHGSGQKPMAPKRGVPKMAIMAKSAQMKTTGEQPQWAEPPTRKGRRVMIGAWVCVLLVSAVGGMWLNQQQKKTPPAAESTKPDTTTALPPALATTTAPVPTPDTAKPDGELSTAALRLKAEQGDADAMYELGYRYFDGTNGLAKDMTAAVVWWRKAADKGHRDAQYHAAYAYGFGEGVAKDEAESIKWMRKAAEQGHPDAQFSIGYDYYEGQHGLPKDPAQAIPWLTKAADQGQDQAQAFLGQAYLHGNGVEKNDAKALELLKKGAAQDHPVAQYELGMGHARGTLGLKQDAAAAAGMLIEAAEQGLVDAQKELAELYQTGGPGLMPDFQESLIWYLILAAEDNNAKAKIDSVKEELTLTEVSEAEKYAADFKARKQKGKG